MWRQRYRGIRLVNFLGDLFLLNLSVILAHLMMWGIIKHFFVENFLQISLHLSLSWIYISYVTDLYNFDRLSNFEKSFGRLFRTILVHVLLFSTLILVVKDFSLSRQMLIYSYGIFVVLIFFWRLLLFYVLKYSRKSEDNLLAVVVIGSPKVGYSMMNTLNDFKGYGYKPIGVFDDVNRSGNNDYKLSGSIADCMQLIADHKVDEVFCALPLTETEQVQNLMKFCESHLVRFKYVPDFSTLLNKSLLIDRYGFLPVIVLRPEPLNSSTNQMIKRLFDIIFSAVVIVLLLSWLLPLMAILIKLESKGPVFYLQNRSGRDYKTFKILKLRTMTSMDRDDEFVQATKNDSRITRIGKIIRKTNVDELPQFFNVFLGTMSVVGPRPHPLKLNDEYKNLIDRYMIRHLVQPGVTGLAQVRGYRGETTDHKLMEGRVMADVFYIENWSFLMDIKIIILTIVNVFRGEKNAY